MLLEFNIDKTPVAFSELPLGQVFILQENDLKLSTLAVKLNDNYSTFTINCSKLDGTGVYWLNTDDVCFAVTVSRYEDVVEERGNT